MLLAANVGFLAIQSVDTNPAPHTRSAAQVASYCSTFLCLGSYIIGHILTLQHSREVHDGDPDPVSSLLAHRQAALLTTSLQADADYLECVQKYKIDRLALIYRSVFPDLSERACRLTSSQLAIRFVHVEVRSSSLPFPPTNVLV